MNDRDKAQVVDAAKTVSNVFVGDIQNAVENPSVANIGIAVTGLIPAVKVGKFVNKGYRAAKGLKGLQEHHITPLTLRNHPAIKRSGFNINSRTNLIMLQSRRSVYSKRTVHRGRHRNAYTDQFKDFLDTLNEKIKDGTITPSQVNEAIRGYVSKQRGRLRSGKTSLNRASDNEPPSSRSNVNSKGNGLAVKK